MVVFVGAFKEARFRYYDGVSYDSASGVFMFQGKCSITGGYVAVPCGNIAVVYKITIVSPSMVWVTRTCEYYTFYTSPVFMLGDIINKVRCEFAVEAKDLIVSIPDVTLYRSIDCSYMDYNIELCQDSYREKIDIAVENWSDIVQYFSKDRVNIAFVLYDELSELWVGSMSIGSYSHSMSGKKLVLTGNCIAPYIECDAAYATNNFGFLCFYKDGRRVSRGRG